MSKEIRIGKGYRWSSGNDNGYAIDNLDTLELSEVHDSGIFEVLFVLTRQALNSYKELDRGLEGDILDVCHHVSRHLSKNKNYF